MIGDLLDHVVMLLFALVAAAGALFVVAVVLTRAWALLAG